jgi:RsiW-degrading membrane proteinase PrsW (M82 family)
MVFMNILMGQLGVRAYKNTGLPSCKRILLCNIHVSLAGALLPFRLVWFGLPMKPVFFWHTPFNNRILTTFTIFLLLELMHCVFIMSCSNKAATVV